MAKQTWSEARDNREESRIREVGGVDDAQRRKSERFARPLKLA